MISYRASQNWPHALAAGCVVYRYNDKAHLEILLLYRQDDLGRGEGYMLPKGHVDEDETPAQAAIRETREEAGVDASIKGYLGATCRRFTHPVTHIETDKTVLFFVAEYTGESHQPKDQEHDRAEWLAHKTALAYLQRSVRGDEIIVQRAKEWLDIHESQQHTQ